MMDCFINSKNVHICRGKPGNSQEKQSGSVSHDPQPSTSSGIERNTTSSFNTADDLEFNSSDLLDILNNLDSNFFVTESNEQRNSETDYDFIFSSNDSSQDDGAFDTLLQTWPVQEQLSNTESIVSGLDATIHEDNILLTNDIPASENFLTNVTGNNPFNDLQTIQLQNDVVPLSNSSEELLNPMPFFHQSAAASETQSAEAAITKQPIQSSFGKDTSSDYQKGAEIAQDQSEDIELIVLSVPIQTSGVLKVMYHKENGNETADKVQSVPLGVLKKDFLKLIAKKKVV